MGPGQAVDWDNINGPQTVAANINAFLYDCPEPEPGLPTGLPAGQLLSGCDDWAILQYNFRNSSHYADGAPPVNIGRELDAEIKTFINSMPFPFYVPPGDANCDGKLNGLDIEPFVLAISNPSAYSSAFSSCDILDIDMNADRVINMDDLVPFVEALLQSK